MSVAYCLTITSYTDTNKPEKIIMTPNLPTKILKSLGKSILISYLLTGLLLIILALLLYQFGLSEKIVSICILCVYVVASFFSGFLSGKQLQSRKFLWGCLSGIFYFLLLVLLSLAFPPGHRAPLTHVLTVYVIWMASGTLIGVLA